MSYVKVSEKHSIYIKAIFR